MRLALVQRKLSAAMAQATAAASVGRDELWDAQWEQRYKELKCVRTILFLL